MLKENFISKDDFISYLKEYNLVDDYKRKKINKNQSVEIGGKKISIKNRKIEEGIILKKDILKLKNYNLSRIDLSRIEIKGLELKNFSLFDFNLTMANLENINLERANLGRANLGGANLRGANLEEANLEETGLGGANLEGANLEKANLRGANLEEANLTNVMFSKKYRGFIKSNSIITQKISIFVKDSFYAGGCHDLENNFKICFGKKFFFLKKYRNIITIFLKENEKENPIGILKLEGELSFLAIKTIKNKNNDNVITTGFCYRIKRELGERLKKFQNCQGVYKLVIESLELKMLRPISPHIVDNFFPLIINLLSRIEKNKLKFEEIDFNLN